MNWKNSLAAIGLIVSVGAVLGCSEHAWASHPRSAKGFVGTVAGYKVRLVAVAATGYSGQERLADHAWTPEGHPFEGPDVRLAPRNMAGAPKGASSRYVFFELEQPQPPGLAPKVDMRVPAKPPPATTIDVFAYLPRSESRRGDNDENPGAAGPVTLQIWHGVPRDTAGNVLLAEPSSVTMGFGARSTGRQPVAFGVAEGEFKDVAGGAASVAGLAENQTVAVASGSWGRLEATHLPHPMFETKPSPTHRFRLLGGAFPPKSERKAFIYDAKGAIIASCGDGPNNSGYAGLGFFHRSGPEDIARYEVQERPYEFVQFDRVSFEAPKITAYSGDQGLDHAADSPIGKVVGVLKQTNDGPWTGSVLYAADGKRWIDPGPKMAGYEYGQFDPWNHTPSDRLNILFEPIHEFSASTTPVTCEVCAADSPDGPSKEKLTGWNEMPFRMPMTQISSKPTARPYMRIEVRVGGGSWTTLDTIAVDDRLLRTAETASPGTRVLEVFFDDSGAIRIWKDKPDSVRSHSTWHPGEQRIRVIAHLRSGGTADIDFNMGGYSGTDPTKNRYSGIEYTRQLNGTKVQSGFKSLDFKDIASFDLQAEDLKPPISISVHSPVD